MSILMAKIKNKKRDQHEAFRVVSTENEINYESFDSKDRIKYDPNVTIDSEQIYFIEDFSKQDFYIDILKDEINTVDYDPLEYEEMPQIDYICSIQKDGAYYFQNINPSQLVAKKRLFLDSHLKKYRIENESVVIVINKYADAVYLKNEDILLFSKLESITGIFKGIDVLYREATSEEVEEFLNCEYIKDFGGITVEQIGKATRKRIAQAQDNIKALSEDDKKKIIAYIKKYTTLKSEDDKFIIETKADVDALANGLREKYFETPVTQKKYYANSSIEISKET